MTLLEIGTKNHKNFLHFASSILLLDDDKMMITLSIWIRKSLLLESLLLVHKEDDTPHGQRANESSL